MTFRERIADLISGGAVTRAEFARHHIRKAERHGGEAFAALRRIEAATRHVKSGTGRKINRMAREALGE